MDRSTGCYVILYVLFVTEILSSSTCVAQSNGSVPVGSTLTATEESAPWVSPSADFAFGFRQLENTDFFLLSIWYNLIPERTIVWYTNANNSSPRGSTLVLTADRGLLLTNPQGQQTSLSATITGSVNNGFINDNGNFLLQNSNFETLWETFQHPADTILPSQNIQSAIQLVFSRRNDTNFAPGRFEMRVTENGNLELATVNLARTDRQTYYSNGLAVDSSGSASGRYQVVFNESSYLYISSASNDRTFLLSQGDEVGNDLFYNRVTLNHDGIFAHYRRLKNSSNGSLSSWSMVWSIPENICGGILNIGGGVCGHNMICRLGGDQRPSCECPEPFTLVNNPDEELRSCVPNFVQSCGESYEASAENAYDFIRLTGINWPFNDYERLEPLTEDSCRRSCMRDCMCYAAIFGGGVCWKKRLPLSNGMLDDISTIALIKFQRNISTPQNPDNPSPNDKNRNRITILVSILLGGSVFINFALLGLSSFGFFIFYRNRAKKTIKNEFVCATNLRHFTYNELVDATNGFKEELGRGSFGIVYKGEVKVGSTTSFIAVKKLDRIAEQCTKEFKTEVNVIGQTHHKNLVVLIGFCDDGLRRMLVYEFLTNGSLASSLFGEEKLHWSQRVQIALGVAKGLLYLHEECINPIIHCDIKPQNILLDDSYNARISDFGLAKLLGINQSETQTGIRGTKGYVAPEWFRHVPVTVKTDVYSFGVVLLEIICCRQNVDMEAAEERAILTYWAYDCFVEEKLDILIENDIDASSDLKLLNRFVMVAIWCIQEDPYLRPDMKNVVLMLEGILEIDYPPCPSPFTTIIERN